MHFKKFTSRFGVMKIKIYSARARERSCKHFTQSEYLISLKKLSIYPETKGGRSWSYHLGARTNFVGLCFQTD